MIYTGEKTVFHPGPHQHYGYPQKASCTAISIKMYRLFSDIVELLLHLTINYKYKPVVNEGLSKEKIMEIQVHLYTCIISYFFVCLSVISQLVCLQEHMTFTVMWQTI